MSEVTLTEPVTLPPTQADLPYDDDVPMETQRHKAQMDMLIDTLSLWLAERDAYVGGNMFVYFSVNQVKNQDFKGPDFFAVLGVPKKERLCWVVWEEEKAPDVVIELLFPSTAEKDKTDKKLIYQDRLRVPEYFWFDPFHPNDWAGFSLRNGEYQPLATNSQNQLISQSLGLALTRWQGTYRGINTTWLRWESLDGELLPTTEEVAEQERQRAGQIEAQLGQIEAQLGQIVRNLLREGIPVEQVVRLTGVPEAQVRQLDD